MTKGAEIFLEMMSLWRTDVREYVPRVKSIGICIIRDADDDVPLKEILEVSSFNEAFAKIRRFGTSNPVKFVFHQDPNR